MSESVEQAICERCGRHFHCGARDAQPCWCATAFPPIMDGREAVAGCLCPDCLRQAIARRSAGDPT